MARSISTIEAEFDTALAAKTEIFDITGEDKSKLSSLALSSIWKNFRSVIATAIYSLELNFDLFKADVQSIVDANVVHNVQWFYNRAFEFQLGDLLTVVNGNPGYLVADATKKIIKRAAVVENDGFLTLKVAKESGGVPTALSASELAAYSSYWHQVQPAGVALQIISVTGDVLKLEGSITYDPLIGETQTEINVEAKINEYLQSLEFNGEFIIEKLEDYIQQASGVKDSKFQLQHFIKPSGEGYSEVNKSRVPLSGYITYSADDSNITYNSYV